MLKKFIKFIKRILNSMFESKPRKGDYDRDWIDKQW